MTPRFTNFDSAFYKFLTPRFTNPLHSAFYKSTPLRVLQHAVLGNAKSKEENKLIIHGVEIEDTLSSAHEYVNDFNASPPFGLFDIFNHLIYSSTEYDKQALAAYKAFDDYRIFEEGYVEFLLTKPLPSVIWLAICLKMGS